MFYGETGCVSLLSNKMPYTAKGEFNFEVTKVHMPLRVFEV